MASSAFAMQAPLGTVWAMEMSGAPRLSAKLIRRRLTTDVVQVLCDESGRLGSLSYKRPVGMELALGDAVRVPFGRAERYGIVVGEGDASLATRDVLEVFGPRAGEVEIAVATQLAEEGFSSFAAIASRLAPKTRRGNLPLDAGKIELRPGDGFAELGDLDPDRDQTRRLLACAPAVSRPRLAALEAARLSEQGQVLVLCPTKESVSEVLAEFASGAARLDVVPGPQDLSPWKGFVEGTLRVAISTRQSALWSADSLAGVVVLDESHPGHVEATQPYTSARDVAIRRSFAAGCPLTLIATVPSLQALAGRVKLTQVGLQEHWPKFKYVSRDDHQPFERLAPPPALAAISDARRAKNGAFVLASSSSTKFRCRSCKLEHVNDAGAAGQKSTKKQDTQTSSGLTREQLFTEQICSRCGGEVKVSGFGPDRVGTLFTKATPLSLAQLVKHKPRPGSTVVVFDVDALEAAPGLNPVGYTLASAVYAAASLAGRSGTVVMCGSGPAPSTVVDLFLKRDIRRFSRRVWADAKASGLPPFKKMVSVLMRRSSAPKLPGLPGRVLGPRRVSPSEWEVLVLLDPVELPQLSVWVQRLKKSNQVKITVS
jgi:primosomal protein N'